MTNLQNILESSALAVYEYWSADCKSSEDWPFFFALGLPVGLFAAVRYFFPLPLFVAVAVSLVLLGPVIWLYAGMFHSFFKYQYRRKQH